MFSIFAIRKGINQVKKGKAANYGGKFAPISKFLTFAGSILFLIGVICFVFFLSYNIPNEVKND